MSTKTCHATTKCCATCNYWAGNIEKYYTDKSKKEMYLYQDKKARCCNPDSKSHNLDKKGKDSCVKHLYRK